MSREVDPPLDPHRFVAKPTAQGAIPMKPVWPKRLDQGA